MKAMVLAAGLGTRLRPLTEDKPKCLVPLAGRPLIGWTLEWLRRAGVTECVINLHYLPEKVQQFVGDGSGYGLKVTYSYEPELLGTAGAVNKIASFFDKPFYVIYSDNFSQWDIRKLKFEYERNDSIGTVAVHWREDVTQSGMVEFDQNNRILRLVEKPKPEDVVSHYVNAGFYYLDPRVFNYIPEGKPCDFAFHVFPEMLRAREEMYAVKMEDPIIGIDTIESYHLANKLAQLLVSQKEFQKRI
jgi:NDP-sugar pyrophosphorylase family protein